MLNETHAAGLKSWVKSANTPDTDFPIQNLPHGVFRRRGSAEAFRGGVAIGDMILDVRAAYQKDVFTADAAEAANNAGLGALNKLMAMGPESWSTLRLSLSRLLREGAPAAIALADCLIPQAEAEYALPCNIGDYTDFFTSTHHALNMGRIFNPSSPTLPNLSWLPIAYHGRASSIEISGTAFHRPLGQTKAPTADEPSFGPTQRLDYEVELAAFIGSGNALGDRISIDNAESHVFGMCLLNDWSSRDVQGWESMPLGPFLAKSFISTISPWIVTLEALTPFRCRIVDMPADTPSLSYLAKAGDRGAGAYDIQVEAWIETVKSAGQQFRLSHSSYRHAVWTLAQMVAHHTENGCNLRTGDLLGTGTQSGPTHGEEGCLMELTMGGKSPVTLPNDETRTFLEDGDSVVLRAFCERDGGARIGFGECRGTVLSALSA